MRPVAPVLSGAIAGCALVALTFGCGGGPGGADAPFGLARREVVTTLTFPIGTPSPGTIAFVDAFPSLSSFASPVYVTHAPSGADRLFVVERRGRIRVFPNVPTAASYSTFLDITNLVTAAGGEEGLLGLAFDPDYATNGSFYVSYVAAGSEPRTSVVARYQVSADPDVALTSETRLLTVTQPFTNHNGGMIEFGPDGNLYVAFGDGGSAGDPQDNGLDTTTLLGKILRIDVSGGGAGYAIPGTNPFATSTSDRREIYAWGFRNPWRFSFDRVTGALWCGDVGQGTREEIDVVTGGQNYGWRAYEGTVVHSAGDLGRGPFASPLFDYGRGSGSCVIGGYVYRGAAVPSLHGAYVYGDNGSGQVWALTASGGAVTSNTPVDSVGGLSSFGEDRAGELYACSLADGRLHRLVQSTPPDPGTFPETLSETGIFSDLATTTPAPGLVPYDVNVPLWADDAAKDRLIALPGTETIGWSEDGAWTFPTGTVLVKTFRLPLVAGDPSSAVRVETRVLILSASGWNGYTYRWRDDQTDADLLPDADARTFTVADPAAPGGTRQQTWRFPSRGDCLRCHTAVTGRVLGLTTRQMNRTFDYGGVRDNQLRSWAHVGMFSSALPGAAALPAFPSPDDASAPVADRARALLDVNCALCHQPGGPSASAIDLRAGIPVSQTNLLGVPPRYGNLGHVGALLVDGGDRTNSVLWLRMTDLGSNRMPPLGSSVVDAFGSDLVGDWIDAGP
jgi:uncharacterized repeat protein (TIGR03806 family)